MEQKRIIITTGASKGGVGKTTMCRAVFEYLKSRKTSKPKLSRA